VAWRCIPAMLGTPNRTQPSGSLNLLLCVMMWRSEFMLVELYLKLSNAKIFPSPMSAPEAAAVFQLFRSKANWGLVSEGPNMGEVWKHAAKKDFAILRIVDLQLGLSLPHCGVTESTTPPRGQLFPAHPADISRLNNPVALQAWNSKTSQIPAKKFSCSFSPSCFGLKNGGERGIRTLGKVTPTAL
jgi:hypothetical protein